MKLTFLGLAFFCFLGMTSFAHAQEKTQTNLDDNNLTGEAKTETLTQPVVSCTENLDGRDQEIHAGFDGKLDDAIQHSLAEKEDKQTLFVSGLVQKSLTIGSRELPPFATVRLAENLKLNTENDFSFEFWVRTTTNESNRFVVLSKKDIPDNSLASHNKRVGRFACPMVRGPGILDQEQGD